MSDNRIKTREKRLLSTWMVVEDEPDIYELLLAMFEIWGIEGVAFVDGEEAITWIEESDKGAPSEIPELAVLDIRLPGNVSGPMVGARIRQSPVLKRHGDCADHRLQADGRRRKSGHRSRRARTSCSTSRCPNSTN